MNEIDWCTEEFSKIDLGDKRLDSRVIRLAARFSELSESPINQSCDGLAEIKAAYRFFDNERILPEKILFPHQKKTVERAQKLKTILAIQDTCFLNYTLHRKTTGLGKISSSVLNNGLRLPNYGLIMHTTFGVSTEGVPLGILDQSIWSRDVERKTSFDETTVPIEEKESFKWLESLRKVKRLFSKATTQVVTVCDREADIYEFFADASKQKMPVLIRASFDRSINKKNRRSKPEDKLWGFIKSKSCAGVLKVEVAKKKGEPARVALLEVRFSPFILNPPTSRTANKDGLLPNIDCHAIYVSEVNPPQDATPLEWMLISSIPINNFEEATEKITWYCYRWRIENFHKILKSGYHIEACRLQTASRLIRFVTLMSIIAWRLHWLTLVARSEPDLPCTTILTESEWHVLFTRQNRTKEIPKQPPTLRTVIRWVAQLGGFFGRKSDGEPGSMAIWRGWKRLIDLAMGWELASK